jgi:GTP-binding protein Era
MAAPDSTRFVSGFVSILGRPNAGKSTLLNALVGSKVAIVTDKPQTTRTSIQGILNLPGAQIVFMDTPGVHKAEKLIHKRMMDSVRAALAERDLLLWMADATREFEEADKEAVELIRNVRSPAFLVLNKIDQVRDKGTLLPLIAEYNEAAPFAETFLISALTGEGLDELRGAIVSRMPEGPQYFPPDYITDQPERFLAAELIREKVLELTRQEVPHSVAVVVDAWEEGPKLLRIAASIVVERNGQKKIVIGSGGSMLKQIGTRARQEMERIFHRRIYLELFVKVRPGWRDNPEFLNEIDWRYMAGGEAS